MRIRIVKGAREPSPETLTMGRGPGVWYHGERPPFDSGITLHTSDEPRAIFSALSRCRARDLLRVFDVHLLTVLWERRDAPQVLPKTNPPSAVR
jgi:hypothetical protein